MTIKAISILFHIPAPQFTISFLKFSQKPIPEGLKMKWLRTSKGPGTQSTAQPIRLSLFTARGAEASPAGGQALTAESSAHLPKLFDFLRVPHKGPKAAKEQMCGPRFQPFFLVPCCQNIGVLLSVIVFHSDSLSPSLRSGDGCSE